MAAIYVVKPNGDLAWYKYQGDGQSDRSAATGWHPNTGHLIGNGWQGNPDVFGDGNGVIYVVKPNGDLAWYKYQGDGQSDRSAATGWHPNTGHLIGNGWQGNLHVFGGGNGVIYVVKQNGDLAWYKYQGDGQSDRSAATGWHPNTGHLIGNGWQGNLHVFGGGNGVIYVVKQNGDLAWYKYQGDGQSDRSAATGWHPNTGHLIGNGWQGNLHVFGGGNGVIYVVKQNGDLAWYKYQGDGQSDRSAATGWHPNTGHLIGNGWQGNLHVFGGGND